MKNRFISVLLTVAFLAVFIWYFLTNKNDFLILTQVNVGYLLLIGAGHLVIILINGLITRRILKPFAINISISEGYYISLISSMGNFFLPMQSGSGVRAIYLKKKHQLSYSKFLATFSGNFIIVFVVNSTLGLMALYFLRNIAQPRELVVIGGAFLALLIVSLALASTRFTSKAVEIIKRLSPFRSISEKSSLIQGGWNRIVNNRQLINSLLLLTILSFIVNVLIFRFELASVGLTASFWSVVLYSSLGSIVLITNITPADLGVREAILIFSSNALGLQVSEILVVTIIDRLIKFIILSVSWLLLRTKIMKHYTLSPKSRS